MHPIIHKVLSLGDPPCSGNPNRISDRSFDDTHEWHEFGRDEYKCVHCGLVVGWPSEERKREMGLKQDGDFTPEAEPRGESGGDD